MQPQMDTDKNAWVVSWVGRLGWDGPEPEGRHDLRKVFLVFLVRIGFSMVFGLRADGVFALLSSVPVGL
jgi:hypothetical protein